MLREIPADLVLTNVCLSGMWAHDAMLKLKELLPNLPVLMMSSLPHEEFIAEWRAKEDFDVFPKPFRSRDLFVISVCQKQFAQKSLSSISFSGQTPEAVRLFVVDVESVFSSPAEFFRTGC